VTKDHIIGGTLMLFSLEKRFAERSWADSLNLRYSQRLLIIGACALASWAIVILIGLGALRLLGY
jgi:hypothetical protein